MQPHAAAAAAAAPAAAAAAPATAAAAKDGPTNICANVHDNVSLIVLQPMLHVAFLPEDLIPDEQALHFCCWHYLPAIGQADVILRNCTHQF